MGKTVICPSLAGLSSDSQEEFEAALQSPLAGDIDQVVAEVLRWPADVLKRFQQRRLPVLARDRVEGESRIVSELSEGRRSQREEHLSEEKDVKSTAESSLP